VKIAELEVIGEPVLIAGATADLKKGVSTIAEVTVTDVKIDTFFQNQLLSKQRAKPSFQRT